MLKAFFEQYNLKEEALAIGVSGGSDSLALTLMAQEQLQSLGYRIIALTVDHGLRPTSHQEAEYVGTIMQKYGIEHHILVWDDEKPTSNIEDTAREARYDLLSQWCKDNNVQVLLTAHHLYDQVETFFMRLHRGSGLNGLCGMQEISERNGLKIVRPLLNTLPDVMKRYLQAKNIKWIEDESNFSDNYLRSKIRKFMPIFYENTQISPQRIVDTMNRLQRSRNYLITIIDKIIKKNFKHRFANVYDCDYNFFIGQEMEIKFRILTDLLKNISGNNYPPRAGGIENLIKKLDKPNFNTATLGYCYICRVQNRLWFFPETRELGKYNRKTWQQLLDANPWLYRLKLPCKLRVWLVNNISIDRR